MKKVLLVLASLACIIMMCSCGKGGGLFSKATPTPIPELDPSTFITLDDVAAAAGYQPVLDGGAATREGNVATALYRSEPAGQGDPVEITVTQYNENTPVANVWYAYDTNKSLRTSAEEVQGIGESAFIAFPSINVFDRGCYIKITAGSGNDDNQKNLLMTLAQTAVARFEEIMPPIEDEGSNVEQQ